MCDDLTDANSLTSTSTRGGGKSQYKPMMVNEIRNGSAIPMIRMVSGAGSTSYTNSQRSGKSMTNGMSSSERRNAMKNMVSQTKNLNNIISRESRVLKTILTNVALFTIAWFPYVIVVLIGQYSSNVEFYLNPYTTSLPGVFAKISSVYNPILYTLSNKECQLYFKNRLGGIF
jgi:hypothetical protein